MAKSDFCFTYYDGDAARDMAHMNRLERGAYTDFIISQRKFGHLALDQIKKILGKDFDECWGAIELVLKKDRAGKFYIEWLENSEIKAKKNSKKQSENVTKRYQQDTKSIPKQKVVTPLEDGDVIETVTEDEIEIRKEGVGEKQKSLHVQMRELFLTEHKRKRKFEFVWGEEAGKHGKSINGIISQTTTLLKSSQGRDPTDTEKLDFFKVMLENLPKWYEDNGFTPAVINSKFNEIVSQIHNKNGKPKPIDDEEFARFAAAGPPKY